jgi:hypothetical protein
MGTVGECNISARNVENALVSNQGDNGFISVVDYF